MKKRSKKTQEETPMEEKSTLHIKDAYDYQGLYCFFVCVFHCVLSVLKSSLWDPRGRQTYVFKAKLHEESKNGFKYYQSFRK